MNEIRGNFIILNGRKLQAEEYAQQHSLPVFYEVIRVVEQKCLFLEDHTKRLINSCESDQINIDPDIILENIEILLRESNINIGNIKVQVYLKAESPQVVSFYIPHTFPVEEDYIQGIKTKVFSYSRPSPNIKCWNEEFRSKVNSFIESEHIYEALLVNEKNQLTEGSKSNLFFIDRKGRIITAPGSLILPGITRKYVYQICKESNIEIIERAIDLKEISNMKSSFITGTSPMILPIRNIGEDIFDVYNDLLRFLIERYTYMVQTYLNS